MPVFPGCWALAVFASLGHPLRQRAAMNPPSLPAELIAALGARLQGVSRNELAIRAEKISKTYREGGRSMTIASDPDALAYALVRMPATYAAVAACLNAVQEITPDFAPKDLLDVGAGPGTASFAAAEAFSSLEDFTLLDANPALRELALGLSRDNERLHPLKYEHGQVQALLADRRGGARSGAGQGVRENRRRQPPPRRP